MGVDIVRETAAVPNTEYITDRHCEELNWLSILVIGFFPIAAVGVLLLFSWPVFVARVFLYWMTTGLGISMGYHRLHTHRSYRLPLPVEYCFAGCRALTLEGGPISWVATHRIHHQKSDRPGDPHSPREGAWWSHAGRVLIGKTVRVASARRALEAHKPLDVVPNKRGTSADLTASDEFVARGFCKDGEAA